MRNRAGGFRATNGIRLLELKNSTNLLFFVPEVQGEKRDRSVAIFSHAPVYHQDLPPSDPKTQAGPWVHTCSALKNGAVTFQLEIQSACLYFVPGFPREGQTGT